MGTQIEKNSYPKEEFIPLNQRWCLVPGGHVKKNEQKNIQLSNQSSFIFSLYVGPTVGDCRGEYGDKILYAA